MKKKIILIPAVLLLLVLIAAAGFKVRLNRMYSTFESEEITNVDISLLNDGVYSGEAGDFVVSVNLTVTVENHRITSIDIVDQKGGRGYEAHEILGTIIEAQSPDVDVITGATGSSRCIMIAVRNALTP